MRFSVGRSSSPELAILMDYVLNESFGRVEMEFVYVNGASPKLSCGYGKVVDSCERFLWGMGPGVKQLDV